MFCTSRNYIRLADAINTRKYSEAIQSRRCTVENGIFPALTLNLCKLRQGTSAAIMYMEVYFVLVSRCLMLMSTVSYSMI